MTDHEFRSVPEPPDDKPGLVIIYTGPGKGKTTAALGCALRALGHGWKVIMIQFIKGDWISGEVQTAARLAPDLEIIPGGIGFVGAPGEQEPAENHRRVALSTLALAAEKMALGVHQLMILDEICCAVDLGLLKPDEVLNLIDRKPFGLHLILTGRNASPQLLERADLITEMNEIRHPFARGIPAREGIDY